MRSEKIKVISLVIFLLYFIPVSVAQKSLSDKDAELLNDGINILKKYFVEKGYWQTSNPNLEKDVKGLIHFVEDEPIDSVLFSIDTLTYDSSARFVFRLPEYVHDSLSVPGYYPHNKVDQHLEMFGIKLQSEFQNREIKLTPERLARINKEVKYVPPGEGMKLFNDSVYKMPDDLVIPEVIPDSMLENEANFNRLMALDSIRVAYVEQKRLEYNDSILTQYRDSVLNRYRQELFEAEYNRGKEKFVDSIELNNYAVLKNYNDSVMQAVNDSIFTVIKVLARYADYIDTSRIEIQNLYNEPYQINLSNLDKYYQRIWLKNEQNDSLRLLVKNLDKRTLQLTIDDGVTFSRFKPKETKDFDFSSLNRHSTGLTGVGKQYEVQTPWTLTGDGTIGFTQTYLNNWKKGGQSALSLLIVLKGAANYSRADGKVKWENSAEIRNGWLRPGGDESELQKNDDKFELTSRFGISAFKKWYYSAEFNYETQFFRGYKYPTSDYPDPISAFMAPAKTFLKLGLDYKPNKEFSLFLSPLTVKNVYVRDTSLIDQTKYSIDEDRKSFWEPGLNADVTFKKEITKDITYETKYKMFINYQQPFQKFDVNWENLVKMKLNDYINMRVMIHMIYDDDVLFPIYDENDEKIGEEPRLQLKQFISVGFSYAINHKVLRTKRVK
ncbi:DUF3078 domain-containing protein [Maribellus comscasis]|uniref:DUF3078 domain-containing protein n=1 Tax=Maribellus comscasis TaxID=2681766 RepID=A0A6I6JJE7_9BACT|nr:DUF3078 domain-containing protein [Maribellus comscasis]QGY42391.1 DUF3078 domain-containing protein [Maribellus comscasis]